MFQQLITTKMLKKFLKNLAVKLPDIVFIMLIIVKMPTMVGILKFISIINFMLSLVEHEKSFITSGSGRKAPRGLYIVSKIKIK